MISFMISGFIEGKGKGTECDQERLMKHGAVSVWDRNEWWEFA